MEQIERATGKQIIRIETNDLDAMEEVRASSSVLFRGSISIVRSLRVCFSVSTFPATDTVSAAHAANEEGSEVDAHPTFNPNSQLLYSVRTRGLAPQPEMYSCFVACSPQYPAAGVRTRLTRPSTVWNHDARIVRRSRLNVRTLNAVLQASFEGQAHCTSVIAKEVYTCPSISVMGRTWLEIRQGHDWDRTKYVPSSLQGQFTHSRLRPAPLQRFVACPCQVGNCCSLDTWCWIVLFLFFPPSALRTARAGMTSSRCLGSLMDPGSLALRIALSCP